MRPLRRRGSQAKKGTPSGIRGRGVGGQGGDELLSARGGVVFDLSRGGRKKFCQGGIGGELR